MYIPTVMIHPSFELAISQNFPDIIYISIHLFPFLTASPFDSNDDFTAPKSQAGMIARSVIYI